MYNFSQYFSMRILLYTISGNLPSSPYTISLVVDLDTFKTHSQNLRCPLSTAAAAWNHHNFHNSARNPRSVKSCLVPVSYLVLENIIPNCEKCSTSYEIESPLNQISSMDNLPPFLNTAILVLSILTRNSHL